MILSMNGLEMKFIYTYVFILFFIFILLNIFFKKSILKENFDNNQNEVNYTEEEKIDVYIIHMNGNIQRRKNIEEQKKKMKGPFNIILFPAVNGKTLNFKELKKNEGKLDNEWIHNHGKRKGEVGCYLSHRNIIDKIRKEKENSHSKYSIIFEDDFKVQTDDLYSSVKKIIDTLHEEKKDFDMIYLGNLNHNHSEKIKDNIYTFNTKQHLWGTHGYLIKNDSSDKIFSLIQQMKSPIDTIYQYMLYKNKLKGYVIYPTIINQEGDSIIVEKN